MCDVRVDGFFKLFDRSDVRIIKKRFTLKSGPNERASLYWNFFCFEIKKCLTENTKKRISCNKSHFLVALQVSVVVCSISKPITFAVLVQRARYFQTSRIFRVSFRPVGDAHDYHAHVENHQDYAQT